MDKSSLFDLSFDQMKDLLHNWDEPDYRAVQIWKGLYSHNWNDISQFHNLPQKIRKQLNDEYDLFNINLEKQLVSSDGLTEKSLFTLADGLKIETVLMEYKTRHTACISTQAGCAMGCTFCATGQMGFFRNLTSGEIVQQVIYYNRRLGEKKQKITNVVMMGMGEPFHNYEEVMKAIYQLNHIDGLNLGARRFTISTVGLIPAIDRFAKEKHQINLAVSLHAASDQLRSLLLPVAKKYPLVELMNACLNYVNVTGRRISFEWALIQGKNDSVHHAEQLANLLTPFVNRAGALCHINVIPLNPTHEYDGKPSTDTQAKIFCGMLSKRNIPCSIRIRRGIDINAGCGQLATEK